MLGEGVFIGILAIAFFCFATLSLKRNGKAFGLWVLLGVCCFGLSLCRVRESGRGTLISDVRGAINLETNEIYEVLIQGKTEEGLVAVLRDRDGDEIGGFISNDFIYPPVLPPVFKKLQVSGKPAYQPYPDGRINSEPEKSELYPDAGINSEPEKSGLYPDAGSNTK
jgi:hypothetical protein